MPESVKIHGLLINCMTTKSADVRVCGCWFFCFFFVFLFVCLFIPELYICLKH